MTLADVLAWAKSLGAPEGVQSWTIARVDTGKGAGERRIAVLQRPDYGGMEEAIGRATLDRVKRIQIVVRWTRDAHETELAAQALYDAIRADDRPTIGGETATYIHLGMDEPADLGADEDGVFERIIWADIHHQQ